MDERELLKRTKNETLIELIGMLFPLLVELGTVSVNFNKTRIFFIQTAKFISLHFLIFNDSILILIYKHFVFMFREILSCT